MKFKQSDSTNSSKLAGPFGLMLMAAVVGGVMLSGCAQQQQESGAPVSITETEFGTMDDGRQVYEYTLSNDNGMEVQIINYGGIVTSIKVPDSKGNMENVILGFDELDKYLKGDPFFGATIGRYGNRIENGTFKLNGETYELPANDGEQHLHGGPKGFFEQYWESEIIEQNGREALQLSYLSEDGEQGYPGNLDVDVTFSVLEDNVLRIEYNAETDKATPVNLTNHAYFNLKGDPTQPILDHKLTLPAEHYTPVDANLIPTGEIKAVEGTPFDFTEPMAIGSRIDQVEGGYDHNWVISQEASDTLQMAARLEDPESGRVMEIYSHEPGIQFYSGNFLDGSYEGQNGRKFELHGAMCLEPQHFPDSPNQPDFPSTILEPGEQYHTVSEYHFSTVDE